MEELSPIQSFYKGKTIFITGGAGLMGKVLIEKLLYTCSDLEKIYVIVRSKRGKSPELRVDTMFKLPMFHRVRNEKSHMFKRVVPLNGDISLPDLGLTPEQQEMLINETDIVFHFAATLRLEAKLKDAIEMNTIGTKRMLEMSKKMKHLKVFVHLSTAFCHVDQEELGERVYEAPHNPDDVMRMMEWLDEDSINLITPKLLEPHPNTYTYSKRLAEKLVSDEYPNLPCTIARPSIVTPAFKEPLEGWVDNLNGPVGLMIGAAKGVIRTMHCNGDYHAEVIPVDYAINVLIGISYTIGAATELPKKIPVYNITQSGAQPVTWTQILEMGRKEAIKYPFEGQIWYPSGNIHTSKFVHNLIVFFFHIIPAYLIDFLMILFRQKRFMVRLQRRISDGLELLQYFTTHEWIFHNTNMMTMWDQLSPRDQKLFPVDFKVVDVAEYLKICLLGARQYCMKEDLSTLPKARRHQAIMYVIHLLTVYMFYFGILYFIYRHFEAARYCLDAVNQHMYSLPFVGGVIQKIHH